MTQNFFFRIVHLKKSSRFWFAGERFPPRAIEKQEASLARGGPCEEGSIFREGSPRILSKYRNMRVDSSPEHFRRSQA